MAYQLDFKNRQDEINRSKQGDYFKLDNLNWWNPTRNRLTTIRNWIAIDTSQRDRGTNNELTEKSASESVMVNCKLNISKCIISRRGGGRRAGEGVSYQRVANQVYRIMPHCWLRYSGLTVQASIG